MSADAAMAARNIASSESLYLAKLVGILLMIAGVGFAAKSCGCS